LSFDFKIQNLSIEYFSALLGYFKKPTNWLFKIEFCNLALARIVNERYLTSEIMKSMKNATQHLNKPVWSRRRTDKLSAAAVLRPSKLGGGAHKLPAARPGQRSVLGLHSSLAAQSQSL